MDIAVVSRTRVPALGQACEKADRKAYANINPWENLAISADVVMPVARSAGVAMDICAVHNLCSAVCINIAQQKTPYL
jgi:hypothetical protein